MKFKIQCSCMGFCLIFISYSLVYRMSKTAVFPEYLDKCKCAIDFIQQVNKQEVNIVLHCRNNISIICFRSILQLIYILLLLNFFIFGANGNTKAYFWGSCGSYKVLICPSTN